MSYESAFEPKTNDPSEVDNKNNASNEIMRPEKIENVLTLTEELFLYEVENCEGLKINKNLLISGDDLDHSTSRYPIKKAAYIGAILLDLAIFDTIQLDKPGSDIIVVKQDVKTGEPLLDLVLQNIVHSQAMSLENWLDYLVGKTWNPLMFGYVVKDLWRHLTERSIAKGVLEKSVPTQFSAKNITILESYSLKNLLLLSDGHKKIKGTFIDVWTNDVDKLDTKTLALAMLLIFTNKLSDVLDLARLNSEEKKMAMKRAAALKVLLTLIPKLDPVQDMLRALCEALKKKISYYSLEKLKFIP